MPLPKPNIFDYSNFREFMADFYTWKKEQDAKFSHRFLAQRVGVGSSGWYSDVSKGRIKLTGAYLPKLAKIFGFSKSEYDYFESLVHFDQASTLEEKNRFMERVFSFKERKAELVEKNQFEYYNQWYYTAIRELLDIYNFQGNNGDLAKKLLPAITKSQAKKAISLLNSLNLIKKDSNGFYRPNSPVVKKDPSFKSTHLANFIMSTLDLAKNAWDMIPADERDLSTVTVRLSDKSRDKVKAEIKKLRNSILKIEEGDKTADRVYQCNFQLFPVTRKD